MSNIIRTYSVSKIEDLFELIEKRIIHDYAFSGAFKHYRGQADINYKLQTRIAEKYGDSHLVQIKADEILNLFRTTLEKEKLLSELYFAEMNQGIYEKVYYTIFQAQHLGIPTPFMDWSNDWRTALYFAIENENIIDAQGQLWILLRPETIEENIFSINPSVIEKSVLINAPYNADINLENFLGEKRRSNQKGQFFILPKNNCVEPLDKNKDLDGSLILIIIEPELKKQIYKLRKSNENSELINLMKSLSLNFKHYNSNSIYGSMSVELKKIVNKVRQEFSFKTL